MRIEKAENYDNYDESCLGSWESDVTSYSDWESRELRIHAYENRKLKIESLPTGLRTILHWNKRTGLYQRSHRKLRLGWIRAFSVSRVVSELIKLDRSLNRNRRWRWWRRWYEMRASLAVRLQMRRVWRRRRYLFSSGTKRRSRKSRQNVCHCPIRYAATLIRAPSWAL